MAELSSAASLMMLMMRCYQIYLTFPSRIIIFFAYFMPQTLDKEDLGVDREKQREPKRERGRKERES